MVKRFMEYEKARIALDMEYFWSNFFFALSIAIIVFLLILLYLYIDSWLKYKK